MTPGAADPQVTITRVFDAPREMVFQAWIETERLKRWWGPTGFTNPVCEFDPRPGGKIRIHMRAPDGREHPMTGEIQEIVEPERLVFSTVALDQQGAPLFETLTSVRFEDLGGKTRITLHTTASKITTKGAGHVVWMEMGWSLSLDRLAVELAR